LTSISKILIANRGEIACRIAKTARRLGIACAAVYSDADRDSLHVRSVDEAVWIGAAPASESYLKIDRIIDAAKRIGADAIHPGYGFLAENADFADACAAASIVFIGPKPETIRQMASKASGRAIAASCGVPVVPGYQGDDPAAGAEALGYPLMIKASAGGGGRGMRLVSDASQFPAAIESAGREALAAFGDGALILEKALAFAHHVEVQIFGDAHGRLIHLFERDCSIQRRHQKFIEESPSPAVTDATRGRLYEAAIAIGRAMSYVNAGTVEFLIAPNGEFYFIEVNTRIQVEHPVTEMVTGLDLIEMQIRVAEGHSLDEFPQVTEPMGHAIEVRVCAEDPLNGFAPSIGRLAVFEAEGDRVDTGVESGSVVSPHYDSMLAKLIVHRGTRGDAIARMVECLRAMRVLGVETNCAYLAQILESDEFRQGRASTAFLPPSIEPDLARLDLAARALALWILEKEIAGRAIMPGVRGYRNNPWRHASIKLLAAGRVFDVKADAASAPPIRKLASPGTMIAEIDGIARTYEISSEGESYLVSSTLGSFHFERVPRHPRPKSSGSHAAASSPMPGKVLRVFVEAGATVKAGDPLVVLEAMKMEQTIRSQIDGVVSAILVKQGDIVSPGQTLVQIGAA
jgi:geranyl-CoA carboxylase alpha subunit